MPTYKFDLTVEIDAVNGDEASAILDDMMHSTDEAFVTMVAPYANNPPTYPDEEEE